jgi:transposase
MTSIASAAPPRRVTVGVDTHKHVHVAVALDHLGGRLDDITVSADTGGYFQLHQWAQSLGKVNAFGIEGTGSYGAGLTSFLRRHGQRIVEVNRGDRRTRRQMESPTLSTQRPLHGQSSMATPRRCPSRPMDSQK